MPTQRDHEDDNRQLTFTERARREQLVEVTIELVSAHGYSGTSLAGIAAAAGITKAAVLYHFRSKDALVEATYQHTLDALTSQVASAVGAAPPSDGPAAYVRSMIGHLREHPRHTRMIIEGILQSDADRAPGERWQALAQIIDAAAEARGIQDTDSRTLAVIIGGAVDAIVSERLRDSDYDTLEAAEQLIQLVEAALSR